MISVDINLLFNIINIIVLFLLLRKFLINPILNVMNKRDEIIKSGLDNARAKEAEATVMKNKYEKQLGEANKESAQIISDAKKEAETKSQNIIDNANKKADIIMQNADKEIEIAKTKAVSDAKKQIAQLAVEVAKKVATTSSNEQSNADMYDEFIKEAGDDNEPK